MPAISVVTATFNRSNVLRLAIESVRRQTVSDWELVVVGDACTDDTAAVVAGFADARIRFVNLARNHGEQSVPNNTGTELASGRYLAYLNHDDLWFSDHLETLRTALDSSGAEMAYTLAAHLRGEGGVQVWGASPTGAYEPWTYVPASMWMLRRELADRVGPWTPADRLWISPSQDWIRRVRRSGASIHPVPRLTMVQISSGDRPGSYRNLEDREHREAAAALEHEAEYRERLLTAIVEHSSRVNADTRPLVHLRRAGQAVLWAACAALDVSPAGVLHALRYGPKGGFVRHLRKTRGLTPAVEKRG